MDKKLVYQKPDLLNLDATEKVEGNCSMGSSAAGSGVAVTCDGGASAGWTDTGNKGCYGGSSADCYGYCCFGSGDTSNFSSGCGTGLSAIEEAWSSGNCFNGLGVT
ncbi:MAG: hypothetical protein ABH842_02150 [Candidatus Micrarchaeota archaeon]